MTVKLTYFNMRGAAEKIRLAFILNGVEFEDDRVEFADWPKLKGSTKFGQMPLLELDDGTVIAQSDAILRYAGSVGEGKLVPQDLKEQAKVNEALGVLEDLFRSALGRFFLARDPTAFGHEDEVKESEEGKAMIKKMHDKWVSEELPKFIGFIEKLLEQNGGDFLASKDFPTIADCFAVSLLNEMENGFLSFVPSGYLDSSPAVKAYVQRFMEIPEVVQWYSK